MSSPSSSPKSPKRENPAKSFMRGIRRLVEKKDPNEVNKSSSQQNDTDDAGVSASTSVVNKNAQEQVEVQDIEEDFFSPEPKEPVVTEETETPQMAKSTKRQQSPSSSPPEQQQRSPPPHPTTPPPAAIKPDMVPPLPEKPETTSPSTLPPARPGVPSMSSLFEVVRVATNKGEVEKNNGVNGGGSKTPDGLAALDSPGSFTSDLSGSNPTSPSSRHIIPPALTAATRFLRAGTKTRSRVATTLENEIRVGNIGKKLLLGDVVTIRPVDIRGLDAGFLVAEGLEEDVVGVFSGHIGSEHGEGNCETTCEPRLSVNKSEFYFRICPQLRYDMQKSLEKLSKRDSYTTEQHSYLVERAEKEERENEELLEKGSDKTKVRYGQIIQLQHVKSNKFLTLAAKKVAAVEKDCLVVELVEGGSESSWFQIMPRFKVRAEGAPVYAGDQIYFRCSKQMDYFLSSSVDPLPRKRLIQEECTGLSERKLWKEANLSIQQMSWRMHLTMRGMEYGHANTLYDGQALYLFHPEVEALVSGSVKYHDSSISLLEGDRNAVVKPEESIWIVELNNQVPQSTVSGAKRSTSNGGRKKKIGSISWGDSVCFRHLVSGRYLSVDSTSLNTEALSRTGVAKVITTVQHLGVYSTFALVPAVSKNIKSKQQDDDLDDDDEENFSNLRKTREAALHQQMYGAGVDGKQRRKRGSGDVGIDLNSFTFCLEFHCPNTIFLQDGEMFKVGYLHAANKVNTLLDDPGTPASLSSSPKTMDQGTTEGLFFSVVCHDQDALVGLPVDREDVREIERIKSWYYIAMQYSDLLRGRLLEVQEEDGKLSTPALSSRSITSSDSSSSQTKARDARIHHISHAEALPMIQTLKSMLSYLSSKDFQQQEEEKKKKQEQIIKAKEKQIEEGSKRNLIEKSTPTVPSEMKEDDMEHLDDEHIKDELVDFELSLANQIFSKGLPPSELSAQVRLANLNCFEVLFHIIAVPGSVLKKDWSDKLASTPMRWAYYVHRLCFRVATAIFKNNRVIELKFAAKTMPNPLRRYCDFLYNSKQVTDNDVVDPTVNILMVVAKQLSCGIGAVTLLRQLVNNNEQLLDTKFKQPQVERLVGLIRELGPRKRFLDLLASLCTCEDISEGTSQCVVSNQELIVLELFTKNPEEVLMETSYLLYRDNDGLEENIEIEDQILGGEKLLRGSRLRSGEILLYWDARLCEEDPIELGCKRIYNHQEKHWASLEDLQSSSNPIAKQLCNYYLGLVHLLTKMVEGRSYNCISHVEKVFPYELLILAVNKESLGPPYRAAFAQLLNCLYLDRHPHTILWIPRRVHFKDGKERPNDSLYGRYRDMPQFVIDTDHHESMINMKEAPPFFFITSPLKFELLRKVVIRGLKYHAKSSKLRRELHEVPVRKSGVVNDKRLSTPKPNDGTAAFARQLVSLGNQLLRMGFFTKANQIVEIGRLAVCLLNFDQTHPLRKCEMLLRQEICRLLGTISDYDTDQNVSLAIDVFESSGNDALLSDLVSQVAKAFTAEKSSTCNGSKKGKPDNGGSSSCSRFKWDLFDLNTSLSSSSADDDHGITETVDKMLVQIVIRCGHEVDPSIRLFEMALELLMVEHSPGTQLLNALSQLLLINTESGIRYYKSIKERSSVLLNDVESYEIWGVSNIFSGIGWDIVNRVLHTLRYLRHACKRHRSLIESLHVVDVIFACLKIEAEPSDHLREIKKLGLEFLSAFVEDDSDHQQIVFNELPLLVKLLEENYGPVVKLLSAVVRANRKVSVNFPSKLIYKLVSIKVDVNVLGLFCQLCSVNGIGLKRNQDCVLQAMLSNPDSSNNIMDIINAFHAESIRASSGTPPPVILGRTTSSSGTQQLVQQVANGEEEPPTRSLDAPTDILTVELLSAITRGRNPYCEAKAQGLLSLDTVLDILTDKKVTEYSNEFRCVLLRFLADAFFDTGLSNAGTIQQAPRVIFLLQSIHNELVQFHERNDLDKGGDPLTDTLSNYRSLVFYGFLFALRSFFQHAFEFQTAPAAVLALREPLLSTVQKIQLLAETPTEQHISRRARSALLKSISGHRRKKKTAEERRKIIQANKERKKEEAELRRKQREERKAFRSKTRSRGKSSPENWNVFVRWLKTDKSIKGLVEDEQKNLIQSIVTSCGDFDVLVKFLKSLTDHVRASCAQHVIRCESSQPLSRFADKTAIHVLTIIRYTLQFIDCVQFPWHNSEDMLSSEERLARAQTGLTEMGATDLCFEIFCINTSEELARETIYALIALLEGGNRSVQERLFELLTSSRGEKYFHRLEILFRTIGDAAKLEIKLEKKRRLQEEALMSRDDGDTGSVLSGNSSIVAESIGATSFGYSSKASESTGGDESEDDGSDEVSSCGSSDLDEDQNDFDEEGKRKFIDALRKTDENPQINLTSLFELSAPRSRKNMKRKRNQQEIQQRQNARDIVTIVRFLQLCMEGHYLEMQNLLRDQGGITTHRHSINIIIASVNHALILTKNDQILVSAKREVVKQLIAIFDLLIEAMQGPCYSNQVLLADPLHRLVEMIKKILLTAFTLSDTFLNEKDHEKISEEDVADALVVLELKGKAVRTLTSMLEGRQDKKVVDILANELEPSLMRSRFVEIYKGITHFEEANPIGSSEKDRFMEDAIDTMTVMATLSDYHRERLSKALETGNTLSIAQHKTLFACTEPETEAILFFTNAVRSVEVKFKGSVHRVFYPKPTALHFLSHSARVRLMQEIDVTDGESRLQEFLESARSLLDEVTQIQQISETFPAKRLLMDLDGIGSTAYGLALMSNFLLLVTVVYSAADSSDSDGIEPAGETCGLFDSALFQDLQCLRSYSTTTVSNLWTMVTTPGEASALLAVRVISGLQLGLLVLLRLLHFGTQGPIVLKKLKRKLRVAQSRLSRANVNKQINVASTLALPSDLHDTNPFSFLLGFTMLTLLLLLRFGPSILGTGLYIGFLKLYGLIQTVFFLKKTRQSGAAFLRSDVLSLWFCCFYDVLSEVKTLFQLLCILALWKGIGLGDSAYFLVFPLFDIVLSNETLLNVIRAVVVPFQSLLMTFILLALVLYGFAFIGFTHFREQYFDEDTNDNPCDSLLSCFLLTLDVGLRLGEGPNAVLEKLANSHDLVWNRYTYDLLFVVIVTIFLLNVVFGIIIDTFGSLREEQHERESQLNNYCFICGLPRSDFDKISFEYKQKMNEFGSSSSELKSGFLFHISKEHNLFDYLGFILYLEEKDRTEMNGLESFVIDELEKSGGDSVSWIPEGQSLALGGNSDAGLSLLEQVESSVLRSLSRQSRRIGLLEAKLDTLLERSAFQEEDGAETPTLQLE